MLCIANSLACWHACCCSLDGADLSVLKDPCPLPETKDAIAAAAAAAKAADELANAQEAAESEDGKDNSKSRKKVCAMIPENTSGCFCVCLVDSLNDFD